MRKIACAMMQKDEAFLLRPWLAYHGYLFGFENLFVMDNGSSLADVRATLLEFAAKGVNVDWDHASRQDYLAKGDLIGDRLRALDETGEYDFLVPLDCDEFIVLRTEAEFVWRRETILAYLATLAGERRVLRFPYQLANHPLNPDIYHRYEFFKVFFPSGTVAPMDHGHHLAYSGPAPKDTRLLHLHFHHKAFALKAEQARLSWVGTIDVDDRAQLAVYDGPSAHLNRFFIQNKDEYYRGFLDMVHFFLPEFRALLHDLGAPLDLPAEAVADNLQLHVTEVDEASNSAANGVVVIVPLPAGATTTAEFRATRFHEGQYLQANPGLADAAVDPTIHFCIHGFREGRPLRSPDEAAAITRIAAYLTGDGPGPDGMRCLELGSGGAPRPSGWLTTDLVPEGDAVKLDVTRRFPVPDRSFDYVCSLYLIEHLSFTAGRFMLSECFRVLKPGGTLRIATPSVDFLFGLFAPDRTALADRYLKWATETFVPDAPAPMPSFVFNNFVRARGQRFIYDRATLELTLNEAGFAEIQEREIGASEHLALRGLEAVDRMPDGFLALESMILEATRPYDPAEP